MSNYPPGVTDNDPHFDLPSVGDDESGEVECNADLDHPCDAGPDGDPCPKCKATKEYWRRQWESTGRREYEREQTYVQDMKGAGRSHLLPPEDR